MLWQKERRGTGSTQWGLNVHLVGVPRQARMQPTILGAMIKKRRWGEEETQRHEGGACNVHACDKQRLAAPQLPQPPLWLICLTTSSPESPPGMLGYNVATNTAAFQHGNRTETQT